MLKGPRVALAAAIFGVAFAAIAGFFAWAVSYPGTVAVASSSAGGSVNLTMQTVGAIGFGTHPTWVSYLIKNNQGNWIHTTMIQLPAHSDIHVTLDEYDSQGPLRNETWGQVEGTTGGVEYVDGKPTSLSDANGDNAPAHTFTIPQLGVNVPLVGVPSTAKNICASAPCDVSSPHTTITFTFRTGNAGTVNWQCFVPCGLGWLTGNGGPMSTLGYMNGFIKVVNA